MRAQGWYWVRQGDTWLCAQYINGWMLEGKNRLLVDSYFEQINETRILDPNEQRERLEELSEQLKSFIQYL